MWLYYFNFERNYDVLNSKSPCILLNKNINFNKNKMESKMENPTHNFRGNKKRDYKNRKLKKNCDQLELAKEKSGHFLYRLFCSKEFFLTFVLSQCIVYWIHFPNMPTFTYQKSGVGFSKQGHMAAFAEQNQYLMPLITPA